MDRGEGTQGFSIGLEPMADRIVAVQPRSDENVDIVHDGDSQSKSPAMNLKQDEVEDGHFVCMQITLLYPYIIMLN